MTATVEIKKRTKMSSQKTWERRTLAGLLAVIDDRGHDLIEGLSVDGDGNATEFMYEELTNNEVDRVERSVIAVRKRLQTQFDRLGGLKAEEGPEEGMEDVDPEEVEEGADEAGVSAEGTAAELEALVNEDQADLNTLAGSAPEPVFEVNPGISTEVVDAPEDTASAEAPVEASDASEEDATAEGETEAVAADDSDQDGADEPLYTIGADDEEKSGEDVEEAPVPAPVPVQASTPVPASDPAEESIPTGQPAPPQVAYLDR